MDLPPVAPSVSVDKSCETSANRFITKNLGVLTAGVTPRLRSDNGGTTYLHLSHYCLTECFPKSHRSDRITPKFAAPSACLSSTNRGLVFILQICFCLLPSALELQTIRSSSHTVLQLYCFVCWLRAASEAGKLEYVSP